MFSVGLRSCLRLSLRGWLVMVIVQNLTATSWPSVHGLITLLMLLTNSLVQVCSLCVWCFKWIQVLITSLTVQKRGVEMVQGWVWNTVDEEKHRCWGKMNLLLRHWIGAQENLILIPALTGTSCMTFWKLCLSSQSVNRNNVFSHSLSFQFK